MLTDIIYLGGLSGHSFSSSTIPRAPDVSCLRSLKATHPLLPTRPPVAQREWSCTNVLNRLAEPMKDSRAIRMSGSCCRPVVVVWVNGPIASACFVGRLVVVCDGYGTRRTTSGRKCIRNTRDAGFTLTHAKKHGINHGFTQKVSYFNMVGGN